jgi:hypothetical protein
MSKDLVTFDGMQVPAHLQQEQNSESTGFVTARESFPRISIRGKQFRFKVEDQEKALSPGQNLDVIILTANPLNGVAKVYYEKAYVAGESEAPDCSSSNGLYPDMDIAHPQNNMCQGCPQNAWGSGRRADGSPSKGKACSDTKDLFVVLPGHADKMFFQIRIPATSLKSLSTLGRKLESKKLASYAIVTTLSFADTDHPQLVFDFTKFTDELDYANAKTKFFSDDIQSIISTTVLAPAEEAKIAAPTEPQITAPTEPQQPLDTVSEIQDVNLGSLFEDDTSQTQSVPAAGQPSNEGSGVFDSSGAEWNPNIHATGAGGGPSFKKDGTFRAKVNRGKKVDASETTQTEPPNVPSLPNESKSTGDQDLDKILNTWEDNVS